MPNFAPATPNDTSTPLDWAVSQRGVKEDAGRPNRGKMVDEYLRTCGLDPAANGKKGYPWCAAFVVWCHRKAGVKMPKIASVRRLSETCKAEFGVELPRPGDVFIYLKPDGTGHTGIVTSVEDDGALNTIEGNTNDAGSREGDGVYPKKRPREYANGGFLRFVK